MINLLTIALVLATCNEVLVERFLGQWNNPTINKLLIYIVLLLGIGEAFAFKFNGIAMSGIQGIVAPWWIGCIATGLLIGSGSGVIHKFMGTAGVGSSSK